MALGVRNRFARLVRRRGPDGRSIDVWMTPSPAQWEYTPVAPYRIIRAGVGPINEAPIFAWSDGLNDGQCCVEFYSSHRPRRDQTCLVIDDREQIVLGWIFDDSGLYWKGCEFMYKGLAVISPVDAALWSEQAHRNCDFDFATLKDYA